MWIAHLERRTIVRLQVLAVKSIDFTAIWDFLVYTIVLHIPTLELYDVTTFLSSACTLEIHAFGDKQTIKCIMYNPWC